MIRDEQKTKEELLKDLKALRRRVEQFEHAESRKRSRGATESEQVFRTIFENAADGILLADVETKKFYMSNNIICQMLGIDREEINDLGVMDIHPEQDLPYVMEQFKKQARGELTLARDIPVKRKNGSVFYADVNAFPITIDGKTYLMGIFRDITERKKAEDALESSEKKWYSLLRNAPDFILNLDCDGTILFINRTVPGYTIEDTVGRTVYDFLPPEEHKKTREAINEVFETGREVKLETSVTGPDGKLIWYITHLGPVKDGNQVASVAQVSSDITDRKRAEEQIRTLSSAVEQSIDGIAIGDLETKLLYVNNAYAQMHGYTPEEVVGMKVADLQSDEYIGEYKKVIHQIRTQGSFAGETEHIRKDGTSFPTQMSVTLLKDDTGEATGMLAVCRDVTEYRQTQEMLKIKDVAIASSINGIAISDAEGNLTYVNHSFLEMWKYNHEDEVLGRNAVEFWQIPDEASKVIETLRDRGGWIGELTGKRKDGSAFDVHICATLVTDEHGKPISLMGSSVDISESKRREEELSKYRGQMARAEQLASLGTLSATVAHQLTQPLTVIRLSMDNALDELEATSSSESVIRRLKDSVTQVSNITSIIERFRNFARKSSGKTVAEINLKTVVVRIARLLNESARSANIVLHIRDMGELPCPWMNETDLEQLFFALIENSIQAADGKKTRQLVISGAVKDEYIELRLSDDCGGIAPENLDKIFEPFFTTKPQEQRTGLGLCIVQDVVSRIGGHVRVESEFGKGATFIISLPVDQGKIS